MRAVDDTSGKLLIATYHRMLGSKPLEAMTYLAERAIAECRWFPTVAECFDILDDWQRADEPCQAKAAARGLLENHRTRVVMADFQGKEDFMRRIRAGQIDQSEVDAAPRWYCDVAECQGFLTRTDDGFLLRQAIAA